jgi:lipopolysaccharide/colanic/teichoic acid biosynthesis glycosyltransferase
MCQTPPDRTWKRVFDLTLAGVALGIAAIPMAITAVLIRMTMGSPVLYRVERPGLGARPFVLLKFRTMREAVDQHGYPLPDTARVTSLGRILRRTSVDELPQLFNVVRGDMSLVGPRPLNTHYLRLYTPEQARRHEVKPGITGLAQVSGRNALSWEQRFALDVRYVNDVSFRLDFSIVTRTVWAMFTSKTVNADGDLDVPSFTGNPEVASRDTEGDR